MPNHEHSHEHPPDIPNHEHSHEHEHPHTHPPQSDEALFKTNWLRNFSPTLAICLLENARKNTGIRYTPESLAAEVRAYLDALWQQTIL